jgi:hypothetical protein
MGRYASLVMGRAVQQNRETLATVLDTELAEGDGWIPLLAVADHGVKDGE